jgi:methylated-DNA-protein-cysteine methyltransferase-like protein
MLAPVPRPRDRRAAGATDRDLHRQRILATVDAIPRGQLATYGQVAEEAGLPRRARLVGRVLSTLGRDSGLPWWRVVNAAGRLAPRGDGFAVALQERRLRAEGVGFAGPGRVRLTDHRWRP